MTAYEIRLSHVGAEMCIRNGLTSSPDEAELNKQGADTLKNVLKIETLTDGSAKANSLEIRLNNDEHVRQINKALSKNKPRFETSPIYTSDEADEAHSVDLCDSLDSDNCSHRSERI